MLSCVVHSNVWLTSCYEPLILSWMGLCWSQLKVWCVSYRHRLNAKTRLVVLPYLTLCYFMLPYGTIHCCVRVGAEQQINSSTGTPSLLKCPLHWIHILILSNSAWRDGIKSPIDTQVWHIQLPGGQLETQQRADDCYHSAVSLSMENTDTAQSNSHTSDIYLLAKTQHRGNYSKLSGCLPSRLGTHKPTRVALLAKNLKMSKDRCVSRLHFIIWYGMRHGGDSARDVGNKNQMDVCEFVCVLEQCAWHCVSWFWRGRQTQMVFQGLYGGWWL